MLTITAIAVTPVVTVLGAPRPPVQHRLLLADRAPARAETVAPAAPAPLPAPSSDPATPDVIVSTGVSYEGDVASLIVQAAQRHDVDPDRLLRVAACESGLSAGAYNARSGATGLFQFMPSTFYGNGGGDIWSAADQAEVAARMFAAGNAWEWACR